MSTRTVIEINHDRISALGPGGYNEEIWPRLLMVLGSSGPTEKDKMFFESFGIRILGQRHHSETLKLTVE